MPESTVDQRHALSMLPIKEQKKLLFKQAKALEKAMEKGIYPDIQTIARFREAMQNKALLNKGKRFSQKSNWIKTWTRIEILMREQKVQQGHQSLTIAPGVAALSPKINKGFTEGSPTVGNPTKTATVEQDQRLLRWPPLESMTLTHMVHQDLGPVQQTRQNIRSSRGT